MLLCTWNTGGDVVVDQIRHPEMSDKAVAGGQINSGLPLLRADLVLNRILHIKKSVGLMGSRQEILANLQARDPARKTPKMHA
jgi:hypothetical protein